MKPTTVDSCGFTLVELLVSLAIIALLTSVAMPLSEMFRVRGKEQELRESLRYIRDGIDAYKRAHDEGRVEKLIDSSGYPPDLDALVSGVPDAKNPRGAKIYFLRRIPRDPFAPTGIPAEASWGLRSYRAPPKEPAPGQDVFDVYSLDEGTGLDGIPYREW